MDKLDNSLDIPTHEIVKDLFYTLFQMKNGIQINTCVCSYQPTRTLLIYAKKGEISDSKEIINVEDYFTDYVYKMFVVFSDKIFLLMPKFDGLELTYDDLYLVNNFFEEHIGLITQNGLSIQNGVDTVVLFKILFKLTNMMCYEHIYSLPQRLKIYQDELLNILSK